MISSPDHGLTFHETHTRAELSDELHLCTNFANWLRHERERRGGGNPDKLELRVRARLVALHEALLETAPEMPERRGEDVHSTRGT